MKFYSYADSLDWPTIMARPVKDQSHLWSQVDSVLQRVKSEGDQALKVFTAQFDGVELASLSVSEEEFVEAQALVSEELKSALKAAQRNIEHFHSMQKETVVKVETMPGVWCWRESRALETVGLYIPGGTAPLVSTVLMLAVPAWVAGCKNIIMCTPPNPEGKIHPAILYAAQLCGVSNVYKVGGSQAIAAMTFGTETILKVDKVFGPGNQYVTAAKVLAQQSGVAIDMPAGPSEVLVWCDDLANPDFVAADLLAQAEHGIDSQVVLICESQSFAQQVEQAIEKQISSLSRKEIIRGALEQSLIIQANSDAAMRLINQYAPEHLIIQREVGSYELSAIQHAGSVFIGPYTPESAGDYASGTNHTLPTNGFAKAYSGVSLDSFVKKMTFQEITPSGLNQLAKVIAPMADAEQLDAHKNAVLIRLNKDN